MNGFPSGSESDGRECILCICAMAFTLFRICVTGIHSLALGFALECFWILRNEGITGAR